MTNSDLKRAKRILVVGCSGGGKSTLSGVISSKLGLPAIHLDVEFWKPGWTETPRDMFRKKVEALSARDQWVMDGTFSGSFDIRFPRADLVVVIDLPRLTCLWRAVTRVIKYRKSDNRPDMAEGCGEKFDLDFYKYIWTFKSKVNPHIEAALDKFNMREHVVYLKTQQEIDDFIQTLS